MMETDMLSHYCSTKEDSEITLAVQCHKGLITNFTVTSICSNDEQINDTNCTKTSTLDGISLSL